MSSGKVHARIAGTLLLPLSVAGIYLSSYDAALGIGCIAGAGLGVLITPDIDQETTTLEEGRLYRLFYGLGLLWQWAWWPYAKIFQHRGVSHVLLIGTATRFLYVNCVIVPGFIAFVVGASLLYCQSGQCTPLLFAVPAWPWTAYAGAFCAWAIQDAGHIAMDYQKRYVRFVKKNLWRSLVVGIVFVAIRLLANG